MVNHFLCSLPFVRSVVLMLSVPERIVMVVGTFWVRGGNRGGCTGSCQVTAGTYNENTDPKPIHLLIASKISYLHLACLFLCQVWVELL